MSYSNIPLEMREYPSFILWRYEDIGAKKPSKVPYSINGKMANVNDPTTWSSYEEATSALFTSHSSPDQMPYSGIGFVFSNRDPYCFIDLDDSGGDPAIIERQLKITKEFDSYSEVSPSGKGLHIIIKGSIPQGRRRSNIEIYSDQRYATMTGVIFNPAPIKDYNDIINQLWAQMGAGPASFVYDGNEKQKNEDQDIIKLASQAVNGEKFTKLLVGNWQDIYPSQSEADLAFIDILAFYTQNRDQITRIFRQSPLGARPKAKRNDYINWMVQKSFDKMLPPLDIEGYKIGLEDFSKEQEEEISHNLDNDVWFLSQIEAGIISVSEKGEVYNHKTGRLIGALGSGGYPKISLTKEKLNDKWIICHMQIHRLVWLKYKGLIPENYQLNHKDLNKNNPSLDNLELVTPSQNIQHALAAGVMNVFEKGNDYQSLRQNIGNRYGTFKRKNDENIELAGSANGKTTPFEGVNIGSIPLPATTLPFDAPDNFHLTPPPGLVGEIARFIYEASPRQIPEIAIAAAIGLMGGVCGKAYNISGTGLNQYVIVIAATGTGKESLSSGIDKLMYSIKHMCPTAANFIGPAEIASGQALVKYINQQSCFVSILGEFGIRMQSVSDPHAKGPEKTLLRVMLDLYNKSGHNRDFRSSIYSDKDKNVGGTSSPAFSILAESTPETFYQVLNEEMVSAGLLPRFLIIEHKGKVPYLNENAVNVEPGLYLTDQFSSLISQVENIMQARKVINIASDGPADKLLRSFQKFATDKVNANDRDFIRQLWNRAHMKALKISALISVGINSIEPTITTEYIDQNGVIFNPVQWAIDLVVNDIRVLSGKFEQGEVGSGTSEIKQLQFTRRIIREYISELEWEKAEKYKVVKVMFDDKVISGQYLSRRLAGQHTFRMDRMGSTIAIKRSIQALMDADTIREIAPLQMQDKYGTKQKAYVVSNVKGLGD